VEVRRGEGVANHTGPEPCVCIRKDAGEASAGELTGQTLSRVRIEAGRRRRCEGGRQHDGMRRSQVSQRPGVVVEPGMWRSSLRGNREIPGPTNSAALLVRSVKVRSRNR
jgi:hypothetical protein